jgi:ABC-type polar amino acid transport system ATPase subunit
LIKVEGLAKSYAQAEVLAGVGFEISVGVTAAILGQSGCGKSTLLRCLVGLERFDRGCITVDGTSVHGTDQVNEKIQERQQAALRGKVGLVFQSFELFPHLRVLDNCTLAPMRARGLAKKAAETETLVLLERLGLVDKAHAYPEQLSGGQRQRVAIARALAMGPRVLLYDEPTSALDPSLKGEVMSTLRAVGETGVTQIIVTHDVQLANDLAARRFVLNRGSLVEEGVHEADVIPLRG